MDLLCIYGLRSASTLFFKFDFKQILRVGLLFLLVTISAIRVSFLIHSGTGVSCEFCEFCKNTFFCRTPLVAAFEVLFREKRFDPETIVKSSVGRIVYTFLKNTLVNHPLAYILECRIFYHTCNLKTRK